jgi:glycosyltransferase involved in cell wall biosynthesis
MSKDIFKMSKEGKSEYCCNVVRIGEVTPIEGSDFLAQTVINGDSIVVRKDEVKEGVDGYLFRSQNVDDLKRVMRKCIEDGIEGYNELRSKMIEHVESLYSSEAICKLYVNMFNRITDSRI